MYCYLPYNVDGFSNQVSTNLEDVTRRILTIGGKECCRDHWYKLCAKLASCVSYNLSINILFNLNLAKNKELKQYIGKIETFEDNFQNLWDILDKLEKKNSFEISSDDFEELENKLTSTIEEYKSCSSYVINILHKRNIVENQDLLN